MAAKNQCGKAGRTERIESLAADLYARAVAPRLGTSPISDVEIARRAFNSAEVFINFADSRQDEPQSEPKPPAAEKPAEKPSTWPAA